MRSEGLLYDRIIITIIIVLIDNTDDDDNRAHTDRPSDANRCLCGRRTLCRWQPRCGEGCGSLVPTFRMGFFMVPMVGWVGSPVVGAVRNRNFETAG